MISIFPTPPVFAARSEDDPIWSFCKCFGVRKLHRVSKNVPLLQVAIIFTYTVRLQQFLAQMLPRKQAIKMYFIFLPHLTSASALPGETRNPEIASFH